MLQPYMLDEKVCLVTGGAGGLGHAIGSVLADHGARVVLVDLDLDATQEVAEEIGRGTLALRGDVTDEGDVDTYFDRVREAFGRIDCLVNNAGITRDATMQKMSLDQWDAVMNVHLRGAFLNTKRACKMMREYSSGAIVNISSLSGKVGNIGQANYSTAKAGMVALTKVTAKENARWNIRANAVQPGLIRTRMTEALREDIWEQKLSEIPLGRAGEPREVGNVVHFLLSEMSSYLTGQVIEIGGGRYM